VSTAPGNAGNLEFLLPGNTGSLLEFNWSSTKFLTDGTKTEASSLKNLAPVQLFGRWWWWMVMYISYDGYLNLV